MRLPVILLLVLTGLLASLPAAAQGKRQSARLEQAQSAFAAAVRVIDRIHDDAAVVRAPAHPAGAAGLADRDVHLVGIRHRADGAAATAVHEALFA